MKIMLLDFVFYLVWSFACFVFDLDLFSFSLRFVWVIAYVCYCLSMLDYPECEACYYESLEFADRQQGKLHFDHTLFYTQFLLCISIAAQIFTVVGLGTCGFGCSAWGRNLIPFDHPGNIRYAYYCLAMLVDGDGIVIYTWKFESYFNWITLRWQH